MAYATVADVQARIPRQLLTINATSQPTETEVAARLDDISLWMDTRIQGRYLTPITAPNDKKILLPIAATYVAAELMMFFDQFTEGTTPRGDVMRRWANQMFSYDPLKGVSNIVLPNSRLADIGAVVTWDYPCWPYPWGCDVECPE